MSFIDAHRCARHMEAKAERLGREITEDENKQCRYFEWVYRDMCPPSWVMKWREQMEEGVFAGMHLITGEKGVAPK